MLSNLWYWLGGADSSSELLQVRLTDQYVLRVFLNYFTHMWLNCCSSNVLKQVTILALNNCSVRIVWNHDSCLSFFVVLFCVHSIFCSVCLASVLVVQNYRLIGIENIILGKLQSCCDRRWTWPVSGKRSWNTQILHVEQTTHLIDECTLYFFEKYKTYM